MHDYVRDTGSNKPSLAAGMGFVVIGLLFLAGGLFGKRHGYDVFVGAGYMLCAPRLYFAPVKWKLLGSDRALIYRLASTSAGIGVLAMLVGAAQLFGLW